MFSGSIPALVTPFRNGAVDKEAFAALVERQIVGGSAALVPVGTTGETSTLSTEEHKAVVSLCVEVAAGRVPVIAGAGSNATDEAIDLVRHAKAVGADAALVVCPYYNKPNQSGLFAHFKAINDAVALPIFLYNVPGRTIVDLMPPTVAALAALPNIIGIKECNEITACISKTNVAGYGWPGVNGQSDASQSYTRLLHLRYQRVDQRGSVIPAGIVDNNHFKG
jgi:4-hydroxy-tetrahydrodipicolinate synthase